MDEKTIYKTWLNEWLRVYKRPSVSDKTYQNLRIIYRKHIPERLKETAIGKLSALDIQKALNAVEHSRTRLDVYNVFNGSLKVAFVLGLIDRNPCELVIKPKHVRKLGEALSAEELTKFLSDIRRHKLEPFFLFCLLTGCRRSEGLSLKWSDIDFDKNVIHIRGTKTLTSDRTLPLFPDCAALLQRLNKGKSERVFPHRASYVTHEFKKVCPAHKLHDLRHTFATRCLECGISMKVVQIWLGHSRIETTASVYTHVPDEFSRSESQKFKLT